MARPAVDTNAYIRLADRLHAMQRPWESAAKKAFKSRGKKASERVRDASPCGRLVGLVRQLAVPNGGSYAPLGRQLQSYKEFPLALTANDSFDRSDKRAREVLNEARRNNGTFYREALLRYVWESEDWLPEANLFERLIPVFGETIEPFREALSSSKLRDYSEMPMIGTPKWQEEISEDIGSIEHRMEVASLAIVQEALVKSGRLDLSEMYLTAIPQSVALLSHLTYLNISSNVCHNLDFLSKLSKLEKLYFGGCQVRDLSFLAMMPNLRVLDVSESRIENLDGLKHAPLLEDLDIGGCQVADILPLRHLSVLKQLNIGGLQLNESPLKSLDLLYLVPSITHLYANSTDIVDLSGIECCRSLEEAFLPTNHRLKDISALAGCVNIKRLNIEYSSVVDLSVLSMCKSLQSVDVSNTAVSDISVLIQTNIAHLYCDYCTVKTGLHSLVASNKLRYLSVKGSRLTEYPKWQGGLGVGWHLSSLKCLDPFLEILKSIQSRAKYLASQATNRLATSMHRGELLGKSSIIITISASK